MFKLARRLGCWIDRLVTPPRRATQPDSMNLRDWADLPPYHPICERPSN